MEHKVVLVTGAASGIGLAIAKAFAEEGANLVLVDRNKDELLAVQESFEAGKSLALTCDVTDAENVQRAVEAAVSHYGKLDCLINNAGIASIGNIENTTESEFKRVMDVNVNGIYNLIKSSIPFLKQSKGVIINMASIASKMGLDDRLAYSTSKGAVMAMTYSVAKDYIKDGIRCNCLCPARIHTPFVDGYLDKNYPDNKEEMFKKLSEFQPIGRMGDPKEVADAAVFLCSDKAKFITGLALDVDGGVTTLR